MELRDSRVYYGTCPTAASESEKVVEVLNPVFIDGQNNILDLVIGDVLVVKFDNGNTNSNPVIRLKVKDLNNNISVSADTGLTALIKERYDWAEQEIMSFVYTYTGSNNGEAVSENGVEVMPVSDESESENENTETSETIVVDYAWKPIELPIASDDVYGVTKLITNIDNLIGNENQPVSYNVIQNLIENGSLGLIYNSENGNLTLNTSGNKTVNIPIPLTKTSQLVNDGGGEGDRFWSSTINNYVNKSDLGIGYLYTPNTEGASQTVMKSFVPYGTIPVDGFEKPVNIIRIGKDALNAYQTGIEIEEDVLVEPNPHVRLYGKNIGLAMDENGEVSIGLANVSSEPEAYDKKYIFTKDGATFKQDLNITEDKKLASKYIKYNGTELENRLTDFKVQVYNTPKLTYKASSGEPNNSENYTRDGKPDDNLALKITDIPPGYRPIAMVGYNLQSTGGEVHFANLWECFVLKSGDDYYIRYGIYNSKAAAVTVWVEFKVLFVKDSLASQTVIS